MQDEANALTVAETEARIAATEAHMEWIQQPADARRTRFTLGQKRPAHEWNLFFGDAWRMTVDGESNIHGAGAGVVIVSPEGTVHEHVVSIGYRATINEAEYEALIAVLQVALRLGADSVHVFCDSRLIMGHLNDDYQAKDERMNAYSQKNETIEEEEEKKNNGKQPMDDDLLEGEEKKEEKVQLEIEPKTGISFPVKLDDGKQLNAVGLRKKSMLGIGLKIYSFVALKQGHINVEFIVLRLRTTTQEDMTNSKTRL
ncbi:hypothetical protein RHSIM_Rhsim10G0016500 [Rhododendron simsii]|uniref:RNase H type-1 domain-containing protein n=1 Tax=Rhododendron simsii TaxID=118357 RepID=A0A834GH37_RHOSS|nr:hypothetical protein RHSIM_Rhsim10G0016500 [Rhododendron simsii]